jgi:hypothetical protein
MVFGSSKHSVYPVHDLPHVSLRRVNVHSNPTQKAQKPYPKPLNPALNHPGFLPCSPEPKPGHPDFVCWLASSPPTWHR